MFAQLLPLLPMMKEIDTEAIELLVKFMTRAVESGDPKGFLKEVLKAVVDTPESETRTQAIQVRVLPAKAKQLKGRH